jgi:hypothetical protein
MTIAQFDETLRTLATQAITRYPGEQARIERGLLLALNGHVTLREDGTATVQSGSDAEVRYEVNGHCDCADFTRAPDGRCKHRWAKALVKRATAAKASTRIAYYACLPTGHGIAIRDEQGAVWFHGEDDSMTRLTDADIPTLHLHGRLDVAMAQRVDDARRDALQAKANQ